MSNQDRFLQYNEQETDRVPAPIQTLTDPPTLNLEDLEPIPFSTNQVPVSFSFPGTANITDSSNQSKLVASASNDQPEYIDSGWRVRLCHVFDTAQSADAPIYIPSSTSGIQTDRTQIYERVHSWVKSRLWPEDKDAFIQVDSIQGPQFWCMPTFKPLSGSSRLLMRPTSNNTRAENSSFANFYGQRTGHPQQNASNDESEISGDVATFGHHLPNTEEPGNTNINDNTATSFGNREIKALFDTLVSNAELPSSSNNNNTANNSSMPSDSTIGTHSGLLLTHPFTHPALAATDPRHKIPFHETIELQNATSTDAVRGLSHNIITIQDIREQLNAQRQNEQTFIQNTLNPENLAYPFSIPTEISQPCNFVRILPKSSADVTHILDHSVDAYDESDKENDDSHDSTTPRPKQPQHG
ncbi:hypothetical protein H4219_004167 [Mycoemilia scoparia]|uniref:Uncharacterized protein n=1 Tax=Mycoemilia scoparia TaxID=417184 RepID=A0A9W8DRK6_9FUNG|nr:hypothetical protein H4219_004167 [Mycoemilia scoparia]